MPTKMMTLGDQCDSPKKTKKKKKAKLTTKMMARGILGLPATGGAETWQKWSNIWG